MPEGLVVTCPTCKTAHSDMTENYWQQRKYYCRSCRGDTAKKVYWKNPEAKLAYRRGHLNRVIMLKHRYNLSLEDWNNLLIKQNGACAICKEVPESPECLKVDHDHETNVVRGLLCNGCNTGLGSFKDNPNSLKNAITYIQGISTTTESE
jgi:hypothetical protein